MGALECEGRRRALCGKREAEGGGGQNAGLSEQTPQRAAGRSTWSVVCGSHHLPEPNSATGMQSSLRGINSFTPHKDSMRSKRSVHYFNLFYR